ncbi:VOC family protein [Blastococcus sp. VKM Ac-2987]|uniref:VOC family protein n=1 Tax=Blastococcus sp. VKM Ac-2987 TaxID=3004141 RepID=UPI0022ABC125|nr:VOC family protein [Blastococcus sp. VKM Ac-2987]MCZ2858392.1 VOC family protein [Blastococcus sp. VKM Ac-2987]
MPTRDTPWPAGTPCWVDYGAADLAAAKEFYTALLGWEYTGGDPEFGGYLNAEKDGRQVAGLGPQMDPDDPPRWTTYFATDDAAAAVARIREAGGTVLVEPMEVGPMGTMVVALDPQGNPIGLWQSGEHTGVQRYNEPGSLVWNEAAVDDPEAARAFYTAVFGFRFEEIPGGEGYTTFATGGDPLGGLGAVVPGVPKGWSTCFAVTSTDGAVATATSSGAKVLLPAEDTEYGRFAVLTDPWGASFSVMEVAAG